MSAAAKAQRSEIAAIIFHATTVSLGIGGAVLAAYGRTWEGVVLGSSAVVAGILAIMAARASLRWRKLADDYERNNHS